MTLSSSDPPPDSGSSRSSAQTLYPNAILARRQVRPGALAMRVNLVHIPASGFSLLISSSQLQFIIPWLPPKYIINQEHSFGGPLLSKSKAQFSSTISPWLSRSGTAGSPISHRPLHTPRALLIKICSPALAKELGVGLQSLTAGLCTPGSLGLSSPRISCSRALVLHECSLVDNGGPSVRTEGEEPEREPATRGFEDPSISEATRLDGWARSAQITDGRPASLSQMPYVEARLEITSREASEDANPLSSPRNAAASTVRLHAPATILQPRMNDIPRVFYCVAPSVNREQMISITGCGISPSYIVDWGTHPRIRIRNARLVVALCPAVTISPNTPWTDQEIGSRDGIAPMHPSYLHGSTRDPDLHGRDACLPVLCLVYAGLDPLDQVAQDMW
ncbi:hypothetical protein EDB86DRAFT_3198019 [Lactarius hatsudake]|nr:hypothetical protein EDB86DRAFT_3198019 [Lactarius hatsudake]